MPAYDGHYRHRKALRKCGAICVPDDTYNLADEIGLSSGSSGFGRWTWTLDFLDLFFDEISR